MRILFVMDGLGLGGRQRQFVELIKGLSKIREIEFRIVLLSEKNHYRFNNSVSQKLTFLSRKQQKDLTLFFKLFEVVKKFRPHLVHGLDSMASVYILPIVRIWRIPYINGMIRFAPDKLKTFGRLWWRSKITFPFSDVILSNSAAGLKSFSVKNGRGKYIHNGFDMNRILNLESPEQIKVKFNITSKYIVGMVARFHPRKDFYTFIESAQIVLKDRRDTTFLMIGDGETLEDCRNLVSSNEEKWIRFLGRQKKIESIINIFDIGALLSSAEGISNTLMEYMALGKPVIATKHGGNSEIIIDGENGFLVPHKNKKAVVEKIKYLLDTPVLRQNMGKKGKDFIAKHFTMDLMVQNHVRLYKSLLIN